eukprot:471153_1
MRIHKHKRICMRLCQKYTKINSTNDDNCRNHIRKLYIALIAIVTTLLSVLVVHSILSTNKSSKSPLQSNINTEIDSIQNIVLNEAGEPIGHILSCPTCCDPNMNFEKWQQESPSNTAFNLLQSHFLVRHGTRTQCFNYPCWKQPYSEWNCLQNDIETIRLKNDVPYKFELHSINSTQVIPGNCMIGQLLPTGYQQMFEQGTQLIKRYSDYYKLIPNILNNSTVKHIIKQIKLRSDNVDRVQESVMALFDGMYHNSDIKTLVSDIKIPLFFEDPNYEITTMTNSFVCPILNEIYDDRINSEMYVNVSGNIMNELNQTSMCLLDNDEASYVNLFDCGTSYLCYNAPAPFNVTQEIYDDAQALYTWRFYYQGVYPDYVTATKYHIGPLLKLIYMRFKYMIEHIEGNKNNVPFVSKLYVYGGHDTGPIAPLLSAFEYDLTEKWIAYAANIAFELFQKKDDLSYWVLISYNGNILLLPRCENVYDGKLCKWGKFEAWMLEVIPNGIDECPNMKIEQYLTQNT